MVPLAYRNLLQNRLRLILSVAGVALAVMLVLLLDGFLAGMYSQVTDYLENVPADFYVAQKGVTSFQGASSVVPLSTLDRLRGIQGVRAARPVLVEYAVLELHGKKVTTLLLGYDPRLGGGPWRLAAGRDLEGADEIVMDSVLASRHGYRLGDRLDLLGRSFTVVGLSAGTSSWMVGYLFLRQDTASALLRRSDTTSFVAVDTSDQADQVSQLQALQAALPDLTVSTPSTLAVNNRRGIADIFAAPLKLMVLVAMVIGGLLTGLTIYSATVERTKEYGVLKALGMRNRSLYLIVVKQALGASALGFVAGLALMRAVAWTIQALWPQFSIAVGVRSILVALAGALGMSLIASLLPAFYVGRVEPARAFRR